VSRNDDEINKIMMMFGQMPTWRTGVKDQQQFLHWFPPQSLDWFAQHGFKLDVYDVPTEAIKWGNYQLLFDSTKAKLVKSEPLHQLAKEVEHA
jgi:hypothetical protein